MTPVISGSPAASENANGCSRRTPRGARDARGELGRRSAARDQRAISSPPRAATRMPELARGLATCSGDGARGRGEVERLEQPVDERPRARASRPR